MFIHQQQQQLTLPRLNSSNETLHQSLHTDPAPPSVTEHSFKFKFKCEYVSFA